MKTVFQRLKIAGERREGVYITPRDVASLLHCPAVKLEIEQDDYTEQCRLSGKCPYCDGYGSSRDGYENRGCRPCSRTGKLFLRHLFIGVLTSVTACPKQVAKPLWSR